MLNSLRNLPRQVIALLLFCCPLSVLGAETGTMSPDRPGISSGTHTVAPGSLYVESGFQYSVNRNGRDAKNYNLPQLVLRTGITDRLEFDLLWAGWNRDEIQGFGSQNSRSDVSVGGKYRLAQSEGFNLTLFGLLSIPAGTDPSTSDSVDPLLGLLYDFDVTDGVQFFANAYVNRFEDWNVNVTEQQYMVGLGFSHSQKLSSFVEFYTATSNQRGSDGTSIIDGGVTYFPSQDVQFDLSVGLGLNDEASNFLSFGVSKRY
jgi:hypothetical protein